jgi:hypothetical protein
VPRSGTRPPAEVECADPVAEALLSADPVTEPPAT